MSQKPFQFKQFKVEQQNTAMKVGTDGVLLGAWVKISENINSILDVGSGTGLIGLMMAQRSFAETIDAVEIEDAAYIQCVENFEQSDWGDRLFCYHASFQEFANEMDEEYDLIISNPPFYNTTNLSSSKNKSIAKHTQQLNFKELLNGVDKLLSQQGNCAFIIPYAEKEYFLKLAVNLKLYPNKITHVKGHKDAPYK
ncbi:MAG TPA: methyltransferase, partial [Flavobacteriaceae bacterium]|nr:methyltransferase [Flavobacteriaceae bacterium]